MKILKYSFIIIIILLSTAFFGLRMFYIGTSMWSVVTSILIILLCSYIFLKTREYTSRTTFKLCVCIFLCSLIVNVYSCFRLGAPYITVVRSMKFIVPGPFLCFVLHHFYNKERDIGIVCRVLMYAMLFYLLLQVYASLTHSYNALFDDEFDSERYGNVRQRIMSPGTEILLCLVCFFHLTGVGKYFSKNHRTYSIERYVYYILFLFFTFFVYMSKSYLLAVLVPVSVFFLRNSSAGILKFAVALLCIVIGLAIVDYYSDGKVSSTITAYYDDFSTDSYSSAEPRKQALSEYYDLFKETNLLGIGHAAVHYDRRIEYLIEVEGVKYVDIGIIGVFYQYGILMIVVSMLIMLYFAHLLIRTRDLNSSAHKQIAYSLSYTFLFLILGLIPLWLHEYRAYVCGFVFYFFMVIEDQIKKETTVPTIMQKSVTH